MNEMRKIQRLLIAVVFVCLTVILICLLGGCSGATNGAVLKYQQQVNRLEEELRNRDRAVEAAISDIRSITVRSETMEGTVDELIELFGEYQRRVEQLLYDYNNIRKGIETENVNSNSTGNNMPVDVTNENSRRSSVRKRDESPAAD